MYTLNEVPLRYHIVSQLSDEARVSLEAKCVSLFSSCIDYELTAPGDALAAFDSLYNLYCAKFQGVDLEQEQLNER